MSKPRSVLESLLATVSSPIRRAGRARSRAVLSASLGALLVACSESEAPEAARPELHTYAGPSLSIRGASVTYEEDLDTLVFEARLRGDAASVIPRPAGMLNGAPVLGYVFVTNLPPSSVGFPDDVGTLALAVTTHPDFDDSPLWDEDGNAAFDDDGAVYHSHWVVLVEDKQAPAGLSVRSATQAEAAALRPTAPMPMFMDSPGFSVIEDGDRLRVLVPADRVSRNVGFEADLLTAYMEVNASGEHPKLEVHAVLDDLPGDLPLEVSQRARAQRSAWPAVAGDPSTAFDLEDARVDYRQDLDLLVFSIDTAGLAASVIPEAKGTLEGAAVLGYVFPTSLPPSAAGFGTDAGILALAVAAHPDFDDTPLWDENLDRAFDNDGATYHVHWVVLEKDSASGAGFSVLPTHAGAVLPPTAAMPMWMDSPGFHAFASDNTLRVLVPAARIAGDTSFQFDAVSARMEVDASSGHAVLRVQQVLDVLSGDLSLPFQVTQS